MLAVKVPTLAQSPACRLIRRGRPLPRANRRFASDARRHPPCRRELVPSKNATQFELSDPRSPQRRYRLSQCRPHRHRPSCRNAKLQPTLGLTCPRRGSVHRDATIVGMERVKGIEPSYSAWKAAALPLSYTRDRGSLTRPGGGLNCPRSTAQHKINCPRVGFPAPSRPCEQPLVPPDPPPLNNTGIAAYIEIFRNQRKEVIQCLLPSAVTSLGSPAKL